MWLLRAYEKEGDQLVKESELPELTVAVARGLWGGSDAELMGLSLVVDQRRAVVISRFAPDPIRLDLFDYFVEYVADQR